MTVQSYALIDSVGEVVNVVLADDSFVPPGGQTKQPIGTSGAGIGWKFVTGAFVAPSAPPSPAPTLAEKAATALASGLAITSTAAPALNGTYATDAATIAYVNSEMVSLAKNGTFADGAATVQWPDAKGGLHTFTITEFEAFAAALGKFVAVCRQCIIGAATTLPATSATIP